MALLEQDPSLREQFREAAYLHALLREEAGAGQCDPLSAQLFGVRPDELTQLTAKLRKAGWKDAPEPALTRSFESCSSAGHNWAGRPALVLGAIILASAFCYEFWLRPQAVKLFRGETAVSQIEVAPHENPAAAHVAQLTYTSGCTWGVSSGEMPALNSQVRLGDEVVLHEGIAEFRLSSGVSINVEGPSALVITSPTSFILQHGTTTVFVPAGVTDFRLTAASCRLTASAAEFGVQVTGGKVDVHVFSGAILAMPTLQSDSEGELAASEVAGAAASTNEKQTPAAAGSEFITTPIVEGKGLRLDCATDAVTVTQWHAAEESRFATRLSMAGPLPISQAYVDSVMKSQPLGYWRFENAKDGVVANEVGELAGLAISGKVYFTTDENNRAVELGRPGFEGAMYCRNELNLPQPSDYSVEAWIKPSHFHNGAILSMTVGKNDGKASAGFYLQATAATSRFPFEQSRVRFLHRDPPGGDSNTGTNCFSEAPYRLRRWQHVAAVKQESVMRLYVDGSLVDTKRDASSLAPHLRIIVGQLGEAAGVHRFIGQMDELAIYSRALTSEEIENRCKLVAPKPSAAVQPMDGI
jgi:hypothetical protein